MKGQVEKLQVKLSLQGMECPVGELVLSQRKIYFQYHPDFIASGLALSPIKLPLSAGVLRPEATAFDGLFGLFADSLPDGWGRLLLDRNLRAKGIDVGRLSPLDRLAYVGDGGMGALCYQPSAFVGEQFSEELDLAFIAAAAAQILQGSATEVIEELYILGGSSGGARPKILVGYQPLSDELIHGATRLSEGFEHWLIKFPASVDLPDMAEVEYAYYLMARSAGLSMAECRLFSAANGKRFFGTKRFDRLGNERLHLHSAAGLMHDNFRLSNMDYGHLMDAAFRLEHNVAAYEKVLRLAAFNIYSHNRDDHSKNVSFLMDKKGYWELSPAYDLTFSYSSHGYHSMTIAGEGENPGEQQLLELAEVFGVPSVAAIIEEVKESISRWNDFAAKAGVSKDSQELIARTLERKLKD